ncbi:hypothetical protein TKK_0007788 [Trichogramma kaykai]
MFVDNICIFMSSIRSHQRLLNPSVNEVALSIKLFDRRKKPSLRFYISDFVLCLREVRMQLPISVKKGENAQLHCLYDTEDDPLYIVKWYKSGHEFYRYVPREIPPIKVFPISGMHIEESQSNSTQVTLLNVDIDAAGSYSCEVSADAPSFQTAIAHGVMNVVELPAHRPVISGLRNKYQLNDVVKLNCTSSYSNPPANLTWYINDKMTKVSNAKLHNSKGFKNETLSNLLHLVKPDSFINGRMKIRCSASIYDIYWQSTEVSIEEERTSHNTPGSKNVIGINYHQPPPNFQLGQNKLGGDIDIKARIFLPHSVFYPIYRKVLQIRLEIIFVIVEIR